MVNSVCMNTPVSKNMTQDKLLTVIFAGTVLQTLWLTQMTLAYFEFYSLEVLLQQCYCKAQKHRLMPALFSDMMGLLPL